MVVHWDINIKENILKFSRSIDFWIWVAIMQDIQTNINQVDNGVLRSIPPNLKSYIVKIGIMPTIPSLSFSILLGTINILRKLHTAWSRPILLEIAIGARFLGYQAFNFVVNFQEKFRRYAMIVQFVHAWIMIAKKISF